MSACSACSSHCSQWTASPPSSAARDRGAVEGAVGDEQRGHAVGEERARGLLAGFTGAEDHGAAAAQFAENLLRQFHRDRSDRDAAARDGGAGTDRLGRGERRLEKPVEPLAGLAPRSRDVVGVLELAENFGLADDHRLEAGSEGEKMLHAGHAAELEGERTEIVGHGMETAQELGPCLGRQLGPGRVAEILDPVAGGDEHRLAQAEHFPHPHQRLGQLRVAKRHLLPQLDRRGLEGQPAANDLGAHRLSPRAEKHGPRSGNRCPRRSAG